jgi:two-component system LytT family response regulator
MKIWKALIVDDERLARKKLRSMLADFSNIEIAGEADSVSEAVKAVEKTNPEIIFLDIQMPKQNGFDLLEQIETNAKIIFVTAYDEYAIRAFEVNALDYLLKPVNPERLKQTIERLSTESPNPANNEKLKYDDVLFVNFGRRAAFIKVSEIKCIRAANVYSEVYAEDNKKALLHQSLNEWENRLPEKQFVRIHRSTIINLEFIERIEKKLNFSFNVYLRGLTEPFVISRRRAAKLKNHLK